MKPRRKLTAIVMAAAMMMTMVPTAYAAETTVSNETVDSQSLVQVNGVYQISTAQDMIEFATMVNGGQYSLNAELTQDIDLSEITNYTPIGLDYSHPYSGTFNGNGHVISNVAITADSNQIYGGLFGVVSGTVKDLTLNNIVVNNSSNASSSDDADQAASGIAVGVLMGGGTVDKITTTSSCTVNGVLRTGGIVGSCKDVGTTVSNCINQGKVTGTGSYTGGIVGAAHNVWSRPNSTGANLTSCTNKGEVTGTSEVGGIVGYTDRAVITSCNNEGNVIGTGNYGTGGIVGCDIYNPRYFIFNPGMGSTMTSCVNSGDVSAPRAGGILGSYVVSPGQSQNSSDRVSTISQCKNYGDITTPNESGICGAIYGAPITYAHGDADSYVNHLIVSIDYCTVGGTVEGKTAPSSDSELKTFASPSSHINWGANNSSYVEVDN